MNLDLFFFLTTTKIDIYMCWRSCFVHDRPAKIRIQIQGLLKSEFR